ncbi:polysaccharide biosynthesis tyrosine autokinase [Streptomyces sp. NBC_00879]|uniref:polysaccharide biosynthesis tyrosine autokinase n=1 Tax=unclassified Streptomyces TaxID=2593676 RepID=UPI00386D5755|nr:polysaccharide biosynthesis tyrosine autokinase [Streptomyces sp. NBC_00885]WSY73439.1 polysaccharide biosynthesis tyrosine autokinase [Streptomyces sp. NBC_00879]
MALDLRDYLRVLSRRWHVIALVTVLGTVAGVLASVLVTPEYRATTTLFVSLQADTNTAQLNEGNSFAQARVQSYADVAESPAVTGPVVKSLGLTMTAAQLAERVEAEAPLNTVLVRLTVTDTSAAQAALISNSVARRFTDVIRKLERPQSSKLPSPVRLTVTHPAAVPTAPSSPNTAVNVALGLAVGLLLGLGLGVALETVDTSMRDSKALAECLAAAGGPAVLSSIVQDPRAARQPVSLRDDMHSPRAEGFRKLRVNLQFAQVDQRPKVIAVTSPLPREGKSSVSVNLAATLAEEGAKVCLIDCDLRRPSIAPALGLVRDAGLTTALVGHAELHEVLQSAGTFSVLASGRIPPNPTQLLGSTYFASLLRTLAEQFDHVVVDTAPVLPFADTTAMAPAIDGYLLVARAGRTSRSQVIDALRILERVNVPVLGAVLNAAPVRGEGDAHAYAYTYRPKQDTTARLTALVSSRLAAVVPGRRPADKQHGARVPSKTRS